jgi:hypothetical protein
MTAKISLTPYHVAQRVKKLNSTIDPKFFLVLFELSKLVFLQFRYSGLDLTGICHRICCILLVVTAICHGWLERGCGVRHFVDVGVFFAFSGRLN